MRSCKVVLLDEVHVQLMDVHGSHLKALYDLFGFYVKGYRFMPLFTLGRWDGKKHFVSEAGRTYINLLPEIIKQLMEFQYKVELIDNRSSRTFDPPPIDKDVFSHLTHPRTGKPVELRPYQVRAANEAITNNRGIILACTGAGKTITCAAVCHAFGQVGARTITIVPTMDLITNTYNQYVACELETGEYSGAAKEPEKQHVVSTWQSLKNNPAVLAGRDVVIVDETHGVKGEVLFDLLINHGMHIPHRIGFTGTMPKEVVDYTSVVVGVGEVLTTITASELIELGFLSRPYIHVKQLVEDLRPQYNHYLSEHLPELGPPKTYTQFRNEYFDYSAEMAYVRGRPKRIQWIADLIINRCSQEKGNSLILVDSIPFGKKLQKLIPNSIFVNGQDIKKSSDRTTIYASFETNDNVCVIATSKLAAVGIDAPRIFNVILVDLSKSFIKVIQSIGRGIRTADDKKTVDIYDVCSDLPIAKKHLKDRLTFYTEANYEYDVEKVQYNQ